jgi:glutamate-ammonia-ligase adenylyltransferase
MLSTVFQWQRLTVEGRFDARAVAPAVLRRIAAAVGFPDEKVLRRELDDARVAVRAIFTRLFSDQNTRD